MPTRPAPRTRTAALAVVALVLAGCGSEPLRIEPPAPPASPAEPRDVDMTREPRALDNIRNLDLRSTLLADPKVPDALKEVVRDCRMCGIGDPVYADLTKNRVDDVLVPIQGANDWQGAVAYTAVDGKPRLLFAYKGAQGNVEYKDGDIVLTERLYAQEDPACCPTGGAKVTRFTWNGRRMIVRGRTGDKKGFTPYDNHREVVT